MESNGVNSTLHFFPPLQHLGLLLHLRDFGGTYASSRLERSAGASPFRHLKSDNKIFKIKPQLYGKPMDGDQYKGGLLVPP